MDARLPMSKARVSWIAAALLLAGTAALGGGTGCSNPFAGCPEFNWAKWRSVKATQVQDGESTRQRMADDIVECGALDGLTKGEVQDRLGPGSGIRGMPQRLDYTLGVCTEERDCYFEGDTEYMQIDFDEDDAVEDVSVFDT